MVDQKTLEVFFDFSSPYGFLATLMAPSLAKQIGRQLVFRPYLMGAAMKVTGTPTLVSVPLKRDYVWKDLARTAKQFDVRLTMPQGFPFHSIAVSRCFYALEAQDPALAERFAIAAAAKAWVGGKNLTEVQVLAELAAEVGADPQWLAERIQEQEIKDRLRAETDGAIERGFWGSPHFVVDSTDAYWGCDKRWEIAQTYS